MYHAIIITEQKQTQKLDLHHNWFVEMFVFSSDASHLWGKKRNGWHFNSVCVWKYPFIACWLIWGVWFHILRNEAKHLFSSFYSRKLPMCFLLPEKKSVTTIENEGIFINHKLITDWSLTDQPLSSLLIHHFSITDFVTVITHFT